MSTHLSETVTAKLRYLRHSERKLRPVIKALAGKRLTEALAVTAVTTTDSGQMVNKVLKMALAAANERHLDDKNLIIKEIFATAGPRLKRIRANARGRTNKYQKHLAHLAVRVAATKEKGWGF